MKGPDMSHEPQIQARAAQHYAAIPATVAMGGISAAVDDALPELFAWLAGRGIASAGRYAVLRHTGPYDGLVASNAALLRRARDTGVALDTWDTPHGSAWRCRAEHYLTDPSQEPDPAKLETDVAFLVSEA
jgi:hypothetical protein